MGRESGLESRKSEWLLVRQRLGHSKRYTNKELKVFEDYFVKGQEPKWGKGQVSALGGCESDPIPLLYRLWFSRDQSQEAWQAILDSILSTYAHLQIVASLQETRNLIYQEACSSSYCGSDGAPAGFIGGAEERIFNFLAGDFNSGVFPVYHGERVLGGAFFGFSYYGDLIDWLQRGDYVNPHNMIQFMQEFWFEGLSDDYIDRMVQDEMDDVLKKYLHLVATFTALPGCAEDVARASHCQKVREILTSRPIPALLVQWWRDAKVTKVVSEDSPDDALESVDASNTSQSPIVYGQTVVGYAGELVDRTIYLIKKYGLEYESAEQGGFNSTKEPYFQWLQRLLPISAICHSMEQGQHPFSFYPELFERYVAATQGEFQPKEVRFDSEDDWETVLIEFDFKGRLISLVIDGVENSDWFSPGFVVALNDFAQANLRGRWLDMYDNDDACVSIYIPAAAYSEFSELRLLLQATNFH